MGTVQEDYFTCLERSLEELERGTPVLRRTTNMGVTWVFFPDFRLTAENELVYTGLPPALIEAASSEPQPEVMPRAEAVDGLSIESIALSLAEALLKGFGGKLAALAWNQLFQGRVPSFFGEVYQEIRRIVRDELTRHDMDLMTARLNAVIEWQRLVYVTLIVNSDIDARIFRADICTEMNLRLIGWHRRAEHRQRHVPQRRRGY